MSASSPIASRLTVFRLSSTAWPGLILAVREGAALIVPVVIMSSSKSVPISLITTSVAVLIFAVSLAFSAEASKIERLLATATYAAVLAVLVGTRGPEVIA